MKIYNIEVIEINNRIEQIRLHIEKNNEVKLSELEQIFPDISSMTLRRDLERLEKQGDIVRTRGGAKSIAHLSRIKEDLYSARAYENVEEKTFVAKKAVELIPQDRSVYLDCGTTIMYLSQLITDQKLFITTSAPNIALECVKNPNANVFLVGGNLNRDNFSLSGVNSLDFIKNINIDIAFMATSGFSLQNAFTCGNYDENEIKKHIIKKATKVYMLMDSSKVGKNLPFTFAGLEDIDVLITDGQISDDIINEFKKNDIGVI